MDLDPLHLQGCCPPATSQPSVSGAIVGGDEGGCQFAKASSKTHLDRDSRTLYTYRPTAHRYTITNDTCSRRGGGTVVKRQVLLLTGHRPSAVPGYIVTGGIMI